MKTFTHDLTASGNDICIVPLADLHIGDKQCDIEYIENALYAIEHTEDMYCILGGDLMDSAIATSIGDTYAAELQPQEQLEKCVELFGPLARKGKILGVLPGNHENRIYKATGVDMTSLFCAQLGIPELYSDTTALYFLKVGRKVHGNPAGGNRAFIYTLYYTHGSGGGRKAGGKINRLIDYANIVDSDIYVCCHTHFPATAKMGYIRTTNTNCTVQTVTKTFVNTGAALNYGGYGDVQGYAPAAKNFPIIRLNGTVGDTKNVMVTI